MKEGPKSPLKVPFSKLTGIQAKTWLKENDSEAKDYWDSINIKLELIDSVEDNLCSFGISAQSGSIQIVSNAERFQDKL